MNHPWVLEQARGLARRPDVAAAADPARGSRWLHRLVYGRPATAEEIELGRGFIAAARRRGPTPRRPGTSTRRRCC